MPTPPSPPDAPLSERAKPSTAEAAQEQEPSPDQAITRNAAARDYIARGWHIFVLGSDKQPLPNCPDCPHHNALDQHGHRHDAAACDHLTCHGFYAATRDPIRLELMLAIAPAGLLAVRCGAVSGLVVLDAEAEDGITTLDDWESWSGGWSLPDTLRASTAGGGMHLFYAAPEELVRSRGRVLPGLDIKADSGYVVLPPGPGRRWLGDVPPSTPSPELRTWLMIARGRSSGRRGGSEREHSDGYDFETFKAEGPPPGSRDEFFNDLAFRLRRAGASRERTETALREVWERTEQPPGNEFNWDAALAKLEHVWDTVDADDAVIPPGWGAPGRNITPIAAAAAAAVQQQSRLSVVAEPASVEENASDAGNAARYARLFGGSFIYVPGMGWHVWDGSRWAPDAIGAAIHGTLQVAGDVQEFARKVNHDANKWRKWALVSESHRARTAMLALAGTLPGMVAAPKSLDADPLLLTCPGGVSVRLGFETIVETSQPGALCTRQTGVGYAPPGAAEAQCPDWEAHIRLITQDRPELAAYLARWAGYSLSGLVSEQKLFFALGDGNNGKSVFIETLQAVLGDYASKSPTSLVMASQGEHPTVVADLVGVRMVHIDEVPAGRLSVARIKELVGAEHVKARRMRQDFFGFPLQAKLWLVGNNRPSVPDSSEGFWRRVALVPFDAEIPADRRIKDYAQKLVAAEGPGILAWCLAGWQAYAAAEGLAEPSVVLEAAAGWRVEEDVFSQFVEACFETGGARVWHPSNVLYQVYQAWRAEQGLDPARSPQRLAMEWRRAGFTADPVTRRIGQGWPERRQRVVRGRFGPALAVPIPVGYQWV